MPETFFDRNTLMTLPGCVLIVGVVCNGLQKAFNFNPKWLALILSIILCLIGVSFSTRKDIIDYFLAFINGFLVFSSALGLTELGYQTQSRERIDKILKTYIKDDKIKTKARGSLENTIFSKEMIQDQQNVTLRDLMTGERQFISSWLQ